MTVMYNTLERWCGEVFPHHLNLDWPHDLLLPIGFVAGVMSYQF